MKRDIGLWQLIGFAFTSLLGTILHFLYEWLGKPYWIASFSGVNESTFEHMKLIFWPMFAFAVIESFFFRDNKSFWCIKLRGILIGLILIPALFYTYNGVIGKSPDWINIAIFFISAAISYIYEAKKLKQDKTKCEKPRCAIFSLCVISILFILFTFVTPKIAIFMDPLTNSYGI